MDIHDTKERDRFWEAYRGCAEQNRVRPDRSPFYVRWAKDFDSFLQGKPLKDRSRKDIESYLASLGKRQSIADWQVRQAEHALKILFEIFLPRYAPEEPTVVGSTGKLPLQEAAITRPDGFRDTVIHDLHPRFEQARAFSKEPGGYLKKVKNNNIVDAPQDIQRRS